MKPVNPKKYNLSPRTKLLKNHSGAIFIVMKRKSRIIMKDGHKIISIVDRIKEIEKNKDVSLLTSAPVCSKTTELLSQNNISINTI